MRLLLARHGETDWNARGQIQGQSDTTLNDRGRAQAAELAHRLLAAGERVERIYASPQKRALETAQIAGRLLGLTPEPVEGLREISFGHWEGHAWTEIQKRWREEYRRYEADRLRMAPLGGESFAAMLCRVLPALEQISRSGEGTALVVAHSAVIKGTLCWLEGGSFAEMNRRYRLDNAQWAVLEGRDSFPLPLAKEGRIW